MTPDAALPGGWRWAALGEVAEVIMGQSPPSSTYRDQPVGLPFFQGKADFGDLHPTARSWCVEPRKIAQPGDILISVRAPVGPTNVASVECCIGRGLAAIRGGYETDQEFLLAAIRAAEAEIAEAGSGSTFASISGKRLRAFAIPLPPLAEQRRIVAALEARMEAAGRARRAAEAQLAAVLALPAALLREAFTERQARAQGARAWRSVRIGDVCKIIRGVTFERGDVSRVSEEGYVPILRAGNIQQELNTEQDMIWVPQRYVNAAQLLQKDDIAICMSSGSPDVVGKTAQLDSEWYGSVGAFCGIVRPQESAVARFIGFWFRSDQFKRWRDGQARGVNIQNLRVSQLADIEIPLPPLDEQRRIVAGLEAGMAAAGRARRAAEAQLAAAEALPAAILRRAFAGEAA